MTNVRNRVGRAVAIRLLRRRVLKCNRSDSWTVTLGRSVNTFLPFSRFALAIAIRQKGRLSGARQVTLACASVAEADDSESVGDRVTLVGDGRFWTSMVMLEAEDLGC